MEREKAERARAYEVPAWAKAEEEEEFEEELDDERKNELYCVACGKKFKSDKQWKNHEQSKKHKEKLAELREAFGDEEREIEEGGDVDGNGNGNGSVSMDDEVDDLVDKFEDSVEIQEKEHDDDNHESLSAEKEGVVDIDNCESLKGNDDEETSVLEAMLSGHKSRRKPKKVYVEVENEEVDLMEYNNRKGSRRNRGGRKERSKKADEDEQRDDMAEISSKAEEDSGRDDESHMEEPSSSQPPAEYESDGKGDNEQPGKIKVSKQAVDKKVTAKKDATHASAKSKNVSKGRKQKAISRNSGHECDTCGQDFESRNKLHKHLSDSGHAALKSR